MSKRENIKYQALPWQSIAREKQFGIHNVVVLLPLMIVGLFSIGYLQFHMLSSRDRLAAAERNNTSKVSHDVPALSLTRQPQLPTLSTTTAKDPSTTPTLLPSKVTSGFDQTGAGSALQNTVIERTNDRNKHLQAGNDISKRQMEDL